MVVIGLWLVGFGGLLGSGVLVWVPIVGDLVLWFGIVRCFVVWRVCGLSFVWLEVAGLCVNLFSGLGCFAGVIVIVASWLCCFMELFAGLAARVVLLLLLCYGLLGVGCWLIVLFRWRI